MKKLGVLIVFCLLLSLASCSRRDLYCVVSGCNDFQGNKSSCANNDLLGRLAEENFRIHRYATVDEVFAAAPENAGVLVLSGDYPSEGTVITEENVEAALKKSLKVFVEYPDQFGKQRVIAKDTLDLERIVVCDSLSEVLCPMDLLSFNKCIVNVYEQDAFGDAFNTSIVAAKVAGFDKAEYGLKDTPTKPVVLSDGKNFMISTTKLSQYAHDRYIPEFRTKSLVEYVISWLTGESVVFKKWTSLIHPAYNETEKLPSDARRRSVAKGIEWYYNGKFLVDKSWKESWADLYIGDGTKPVGPEVPSDFVDGDGSLGVLEGHMSTINYDGSQLYRYWMRADVQGESSFAFASASKLLNNPEYAKVAVNLLDYGFGEYRDGLRNDPESPSYGLLGWAITHKGNYYGDDNARYILGALGAAAFLNEHKFDKEIAEAIVGNFRTSGAKGFRGCILYEPELRG